jgi:hypothetical protein
MGASTCDRTLGIQVIEVDCAIRIVVEYVVRKLL